MGLFRRETRALPNPAPLTDARLVEIFAPNMTNVAGVALSAETAPKLTAVWRAVALLSGVVAALPLKRYQPAQGGRVEVDAPLLVDPHPTFTRFELLELAMVQLLLNGNFYAVKQTNKLGDVLHLLPVAGTVTPKLDDDGNKTFEVPAADGTERKTVGSDIILHIPGMGYNGVQGWSPIAMARQALAVGVAAEEFSARFFSNGSHLGGVLQTDNELTPDQAKDAKRSFHAKTAGLAKAHEVAVLQKGMKYQQIGIAPEDAQLIESRQFTIQDVGRLYGVPNHMLNETAGSTSWGSGLSEQVRGLLVFTAGPWLSRIEARFTKELAAPGEYDEFTRAGLLQSTTKERYDAYELGIRAGFLTPNEARALENLPPSPPSNAESWRRHRQQERA